MEHEEIIYSEDKKIEALYKYEKIVMHHLQPNNTKIPKTASNLSWDKFIESVTLLLYRVKGKFRWFCYAVFDY